MKKEIKLLILIIILILLIIFCRSLLNIDDLNYTINYDDIKFEVNEFYDKNSYYIEIKSSDNIFPIEIYEDFNGKRKIIDEVYYYSNKQYSCLLPIINGKIYSDMMCYKDNILYNYNDIKGTNSKLDNYVDSINKYNKSKFSNDLSNYKTINTIKLYNKNQIENNIAITTYKGIIVNNEEINLFEKDIYNNKISVFIDNYYLIADYSKNYEFEEFYVVNLSTKEIFTIKSKTEISLDSYIQGIVDNEIYLYDKDNENQYRINISDKKVDIISSDNHIKYYKNNKWEKLNKTKANKELYFDYTNLDNNFTDYDKVVETEYYYYLFKANDLYRVNKLNIEIKKFILSEPTDLVTFNKDYLYYVKNNRLYYYSDVDGLKVLLENSELEFNDTIKYYIY